MVYIGQAGARKNGEGILNRLQEHKRNPEKDYWTEAIVFTTSNNSFGPTEISYLENRFCNLAIQAKRYVVKNGNDPTPGNITEEKESELEEFIDNAKIIMGTLGHKFFVPLAASTPTPVVTEKDMSDTSDELLYFDHSGVKATGKLTSDGFVVLKYLHHSSDSSSKMPCIHLLYPSSNLHQVPLQSLTCGYKEDQKPFCFLQNYYYPCRNQCVPNNNLLYS